VTVGRQWAGFLDFGKSLVGGEFITGTSLLDFRFVISLQDKKGSVWERSSSTREAAVVHFLCDNGEAVYSIFGF